MILCAKYKNKILSYGTVFSVIQFICDNLYHSVIKLKKVIYWRRHPDLNRGSEFCRLVPYRLAMSPYIIYYMILIKK